MGGLSLASGVENRYRYNGKELNTELGLGGYDYGARMYDPSVGRWNGVDAVGHLYSNTSPYVYVLNRPTSAIDPDGRLVIFINGNEYGSGASGYRTWWYRYPKSITHSSVFPNQRGTSSYWGNFDDRVMNHLNDHNAIYRDGSVGGAPLSRSLSVSYRYNDGYNQGMHDAAYIISLVTDREGNMKETIKVITHSMGSAYGKGFVQALLDYARNNGISRQVQISLVADFDPYQAAKLRAHENVYTFQRNNENNTENWHKWSTFQNIWHTWSITGALANQKQEGVEDFRTNSDQASHMLNAFLENINELEEGRYVWDDKKKEWICINCTDE